jgi:mRNA-degrading endonuclease RelE of RelBE toxin-antitoxin system
MNYKIIATEDFERQLRRLSKKYSSITNDYAKFLEELLKNPEMGDKIGNDIRKVRMAITSKGKGKSGGARIITYHILIDVINTKIYLLTIYDKSERGSISKKEIQNLKEINLLV